jgi:integrase
MPRRRNDRHIRPEKFAAVIRAFQASDKFARLAASTQYSYRRVLRIAEQERGLGGLDVSEVDAYLAQAFLDGLSDRPGVQGIARVALKSLERWALVRRLLPRPISIGLEVVKSDGAREPWSDAEVELAEARARPDLARVVTLAASTGQRISDLAAMRWSAFRSYRGFEGVDIVQKKTGKQLWVPLTPELQAALASWSKDSVFVLVAAKGRPWSTSTLSSEWCRERDRNPALAPLAERKLTLHGLRASAVIRLRRAGVSAPLIADSVGMSVPMVARYSRRSDQSDNAIHALQMAQRARGERDSVIPFPKPLKSLDAKSS